MKDFVKAVEYHARVRKLDSADAYWVCAYANNQHDLDADIPDDPKQSAFFKAMQLCKVSGTTEHSLRYGVASQCPAAQCVQ